MSDTPRTDDRIVVVTMLQSHPKMEMVNAPFARELERELNAANDLFRKLNIHSLDLADRIKRLEEAGDRMVNEGWNEPHLAGLWRKAKEDKP